MNGLVRQMVLFLFVWLMLAGVCLGKEVYLKDGGIIDCQSVWRKGGKVVIKVNRDIVEEFDSSEIDLRRTFPKSGSSSRQLQSKVTASKTATATAKPAPTPATVTTPKSSVPPPVASTTPAPKPAALPAPLPAPEVNPQSSAPAGSGLPPDKAELERRQQEAVKMMAEAVLKKDSELMKKALEMQKSAMPPQGSEARKKADIPFSVLLVLCAIGVIVCLLIIAGQWMVFERAGQAGWKCLIPFYNLYILMEIAGKPGWWMFLLFIPLIGVAVYLFAMLSLARKFGRSELFGVGLFFLPMIFFPVLAFGGSEYQG